MGVGFEVLADEFSLAAPFLPMSIYFLSDCGDESAEARDERSHCETVVTYDHCWIADLADLGTHTDHTAPVQFDKLFEIEGQAIRLFNWAGSH